MDNHSRLLKGGADAFRAERSPIPRRRSRRPVRTHRCASAPVARVATGRLVLDTREQCWRRKPAVNCAEQLRVETLVGLVSFLVQCELSEMEPQLEGALATASLTCASSDTLTI